LNEIIIEKLLEKRDLYLNTLKHIEFQLVTDPSDDEINELEKLKTSTINELKKIEQEISFINSEK